MLIQHRFTEWRDEVDENAVGKDKTCFNLIFTLKCSFVSSFISFYCSWLFAYGYKQLTIQTVFRLITFSINYIFFTNLTNNFYDFDEQFFPISITIYEFNRLNMDTRVWNRVPTWTPVRHIGNFLDSVQNLNEFLAIRIPNPSEKSSFHFSTNNNFQ